MRKGRPRDGQAPERGVVEVKTPRDDPRAPAVREQVSRCWGRYRLVLVTNAGALRRRKPPVAHAIFCTSF